MKIAYSILALVTALVVGTTGFLIGGWIGAAVLVVISGTFISVSEIMIRKGMLK